MARIKSALEIALEKTESVKSDKASISQYEAKQSGKRLANSYLENPELSLEAEIKKAPADQRDSLKEGLFDVLVSQIALPAGKDDEKRIAAVGKGLSVLIPDSRFSALYGQLTQALTQYLDETEQFEQMLKQQYGPKLRQKEEELSRRMGQQVRLDPFQDPEFVAFYNQNMGALKDRYQSAVDQVREEAQKLFASPGE
ncbi:DUF6657 family protein [Breznakiella homolactica]|uniref:Uncharacterized protein n=1 Tax=Breznakiella homolactica TaxID=2798577 RepID=A0A7T7XRE1_9SPIR|nr:DUF6657 family protein [Breznakiella homolactica]QQO11101.1 hypothetical protein JFL75_09335 [Breznakiella homolactica]